MTIKITAKRTIGLGCIKGDTNLIKNVTSIEDRGEYWEAIKNKNWSTFINKEDWEIEIKKGA